MGHRKSLTCMGKATKGPLTEYDTEEEAQQGATHARLYYQRDLTPYQCDRCRLWHLSPTDRRTPSKKCHDCVSGDGIPKDAYATQESAQRRAKILRTERGVVLQVYSCLYGAGWHLTKG
jgi:hypothetical protein